MNTEQLSDAKLEVDFQEKISRLFIFRGLWGFIMVWPIMLWRIWYGIVNFLHFWYMLILGKRNKSLWESQVRFHNHITKWNSYFNCLSNKRPKFIED